MDDAVREEVIEWISKPGNEDLLEALKLLKEDSESKDWYDDLENHEKQSLEKGRKDHRDGNTLTSEELWKKHV